MKHITIPASKSITNRVLLLSAIGKSPVVLRNVLESDDTVYMRQVLSSFGVVFEDLSGGIKVIPPKVLEADGKTHFIGNAGTVARFVSAMSLVVHDQYGLDGVDRMRERPQKDLLEALESLGVDVVCEEKEGSFPVRFTGKGGFLDSNEVTLSGTVSSQFVSALLLVSPRIEGGLTIRMTEVPPSQPYIDMTLEILKIWGVRVDVSDDQTTMTIKPGMTPPEAYDIPSDMSGASYPLAWATLTQTPLTIEGFGSNTLQGDEQFVSVCESFGAKIDRKSEDLSIENIKTGKLENLKTEIFDFSAMPDVAMTGMIMACFFEGEYTFTGLESLRVKECDRIAAMVEGFEQLGINVSVQGDDVTITGGDYWQNNIAEGIQIQSYDDHRIAMCFGILRSKLDQTVSPSLRKGELEGVLFEILEPECVAKTWPNFWLDLAYWEDQLRPVSASIITRDNQGKQKYLLVKKPRKDNAWQFPQGGVDEGENGIQAAGRELNEECGDDIHVKYIGGRPVGDYRYFFPVDFQRWQQENGTEKKVWKGACVSFYRALYINGEVQVDGVELIDHAWVEQSEIQDYVSDSYWDAVKGFW